MMNIIEFFKNIFQMFIDWISKLFNSTSKPTTTKVPTTTLSKVPTKRIFPRITTVVPRKPIVSPEPEYIPEEMYRM
jgi:hypothetical protein